MLNSKFVATVNTFSGSTERPAKQDRNGKDPIILSVISGKAPNRTVLSGTVAERAGLEVGKTYLIQVRETEANEYGRQFRFEKIGEPSMLDVLDMEDRLGEPTIIDVSTKSNVDTNTGEVVDEEVAEEYDQKRS